MRGLYTATLLWDLTRLYAKRPDFHGTRIDFGKGFDLICGTSTGSIIASGLAVGVELKTLVDLYRDHGPTIFPDPAPAGKWPLYRWAWRRRHRPSSNADVLEKALRRWFQEKTLSQVHQERGVALCIPAVNMATRGSKVFKTPHCARFTNDRDYRLVDVCMASSAAPIMMPLRAVNDPDDGEKSTLFADGGLWANNPTLVGMLEALELADSNRPIEVLSLPTCAPSSARVLTPADAAMGVADWRAGIGVVEVIMDAQASGTANMAQILARRLTGTGRQVSVFRVTPSAPSADQTKFLGLDRASPQALQVLADLGKADAQLLHSRATNGHDELGRFLDDLIHGLKNTNV